MAAKKQPGRFTIQFNPADPQQKQVIELLNRQGRRKAVFLTSAVLSYCGQAGSAPAPMALEPALIEQIVQKVLQCKSETVPPAADSMLPRSALPSAAGPTQTAAPQEPALPDDELAAISDMIDAFRQ